MPKHIDSSEGLINYLAKENTKQLQKKREVLTPNNQYITVGKNIPSNSNLLRYKCKKVVEI